jgi:hypothetical protein
VALPHDAAGTAERDRGIVHPIKRAGVALPQPRSVDDVVPHIALPVITDDVGAQRLSNGDKLLDVVIDWPGNDDLTARP